tara:strand:+ start:619 stop:1971 length:1353 start_codon:yes stop_codon:yes gene_type:complete
MANKTTSSSQSLIAAAQRMYSAKYAEAQKDVAPILEGVQSASVQIENAISQKRKEQKEKSEKIDDSFKDILLSNPTLRPQLSAKLESLQDQYYDNLKTSEGAFVSRENKRKAAEANNIIAGQLAKYESQLRSVDLNKKGSTNVSNANKRETRVDNVIFNDKSLVDNVIIKDDGLYFINSKKEEVPLDQYKQPKEVFQVGIDGMIDTFKVVQGAGSKGLAYEGSVEEEVEANTKKFLNTDNFESLLFDDIGTFNWAKENMVQEFGENSGVKRNESGKIEIVDEAKYLDNLETLKDRVATDPQKYKDDFRGDYLASAKAKYTEAKSAYDAENIKESGTYKDRLNDFQRFVTSYNIAAENKSNVISLPDGRFAKYEGEDKYRLLNRNNIPIEGPDGLVSDQDLVNIAGMPSSFVQQLDRRYMGPMAGGEFDRRTEQEKANSKAQDLINKYTIK